MNTEIQPDKDNFTEDSELKENWIQPDKLSLSGWIYRITLKLKLLNETKKKRKTKIQKLFFLDFLSFSLLVSLCLCLSQISSCNLHQNLNDLTFPIFLVSFV